MLAVGQMKQPLSVMSVEAFSANGVKKNFIGRKGSEIMNGPALKPAMSPTVIPARLPVGISCRVMPTPGRGQQSGARHAKLTFVLSVRRGIMLGETRGSTPLLSTMVAKPRNKRRRKEWMKRPRGRR